MSAGAIGLVPPSTGLDVNVQAVQPTEVPLDEFATSFVTPEDLAAVGPNLEPKYRICSIQQPDGRTLRVTVAETTWQSGAAFLRAMRDPGRVPAATRERLLRTLVDETGWLPGLAGVHCLLLTADRRIVATRRPPRSEFSAMRWSTSYEEQLTAIDFNGRDDPFSATARRGYLEEFQLPTEGVHVRIIGAIAETEILNRVLLALVETDATADDLIRAAAAGLAEIDAIRTIASTPDSLRHEAQRDDLHPTAALRLQTLANLMTP